MFHFSFTRSQAPLALTALVLGASLAAADVRLPAILSDNMVVQQKTQAAIWGWASPGEKVTVTASWPKAKGEAVTDASGNWLVRIPTPEAGGPYTVTVAGNTSITLRNVLVGEVWVCSGQSNMEMTLAQGNNGKEEVASAKHPTMRLFMVPNTVSIHPRMDTEAAWTECTPQSAAGFSAVGYFFARELQAKLNVPVGLISSDWGGTPAESWMNEKALAPFKDYAPTLSFLETIRKDPAARDTMVRKARENWWGGIDKVAKVAPDWTGVAFDDAAWKPITVPASWGPDGLGAFDGIVYLRKTFDLPAERAGNDAQLDLGPIDDYDDVWVNGSPIASTHEEAQWNVPRTYAVPISLLKAGKNVIGVRVLDTAGPGGMNGKAEQLVLRATAGAWSMSVAGQWKYLRGPAVSKLPPVPTSVAVGPYTASCLFNGMITPIMRHTIRGALWYQGESNRGGYEQYRTLFPGLIKNWREVWGIGDFPFYFVQIAPFNYGGDKGETSLLREAQALALKLPNTGMAVTMDIANISDIHPSNKQDVGKRLSLWALAQTYGQTGFEYSGPLYKSMAADGNKIRLRFDHTGAGLAAKGGELKNFVIAGEDKVFYKATAVIDGDGVVVSSPKVAKPAAVRYCWGTTDEGTLSNKEGLPAPSFRTDDWTGPMGPVADDK